MTTPTGSLTPDTLVHGRYRVIRQIGRGGMGAVYEAEDARLGNRVALKQTLVRGPQLDAAFEREARVLAALRHPALPVVSDYFTEGEGQFLVMQYIPGEDLATLLQRRGAPFGWPDVRPWAVELLDALDYLHTQSPPIIHRDIKPQNLKLTPRGEIVLLDFGLAKRAAGEAVTAASVYGYTPFYAPLEQIQGSGTDPRSDLYSLAATLYALLTNAAPASALDRAAALFQGDPDPLRPVDELAPGLPPEAAALIGRGLALQLADRPPSAAAAREALSHAAQPAPSSAGLPTVALGRPPAPPPQPVGLPPPPRPLAPALPARRGGWAVPTILLTMVLLCAVLAFATSRLVTGVLGGITIPGPDDDIATALAVITQVPAALGNAPTADPREEDPADPDDGPDGSEIVATVAAAQTQAALGGVELPNVAATVAAVQTEVAAAFGDALDDAGDTSAGGDGPQPALSFGEAGSGQGFLDEPGEIAVGPDGAIYVADYQGGRVQRFSPAGQFERSWVLDDARPITGLVADREGRVFVAQNHRVGVFDGASGAPVGTITEGGGRGLMAMALTGAGELLGVPTASEDVVRLAAGGEERARVAAPLASAGAEGRILAVAADGGGAIYLVGENGKAVFAFTPNGAYRDRFAVEAGWGFSTLAVDGHGRIFVTTFLDGVQVFDGNGRLLGAIPVEGVPDALCFDAANNLYVLTNTPRVYKFAADALP